MQKAVAVISDIHSNFEALSAVLEDLRSQEVSEIVCLGDIVGYASGVKACLRAVQELNCPVVMGNHDEAACRPHPPEDLNDTARAGVMFSASCLKAKDRLWLSSLPRTLEIDGVLFTHASLESPFAWNYILTPFDALRHFVHQTTHLSFCGHTHSPAMWFASGGSHVNERAGHGEMAIPLNGKVLVNVGSVGQPRDGDSRACYVIYRPDLGSVEFRRVAYDIKKTKKKILRAGLPRFTAQRLSLGR
jgi:diadenosine tetraphosphatase ApaH/serine/threonine PP2A family protein phosphatase